MLSPVLVVSRSRSVDILGIWMLKKMRLRRVMFTTKTDKELNRLINMLNPALIFIDAAHYWTTTPRRVGLLLQDMPELNIAVFNVNAYEPERLVDFLRYGARSVINFNCGISKFRRGIVRVLHNKEYISPDVLEAYENLPDDELELKPDITARQEDVKQLILLAKSDKQIAGILGLSVKTVEGHKNSLFKKYCVKNKWELLRECYLLDEIRKEDICG
jgi:DNA-binding NarL/FixJ family response regulator